jgi:molybdopterin/thiamine biosynthesis adenylyltransferase
MSDTLYVNPWRFRAWSPRGVTLGGIAGRTVPRTPVLDSLRRNNAAVDAAAVERAGLNSLVTDRFLLPSPTPLDHAFAPQLGFFSFWPGPPEERLLRLAGSSVGLLGVGGLGSQVAHVLAAAGVGRIVLCDRDVVELSNLNRQLYDTEDLGRSKVEAAAERLRRLRPGIVVEPLRRTLTTASDIVDAVAGVDVVVRAVDSPITVAYEVNLACRRMGIPHMGGGFLETWSIAGPFISADGPCLRCLVAPPDMELPDDARKVPTFAPLTFWLTSQVSGDTLRHLAGLGRPWLQERTVMLDWRSGEMREDAYRPLAGRCPGCGAEHAAAGGPAVAVASLNGRRRRDGEPVANVPRQQGGRETSGPGVGGGGAGAGRGRAVEAGPVAGGAGPGLRGAAVPGGTADAGPLVGIPPVLVALCAILAGLALLQAPLPLRLATVLGGELLAGAAGVVALRPRSVLNGYLWGAAWAAGVVMVGSVQLVLTSPAIMARPLAGVATILVGVPIDVLLLSLPGLLAAWAATRANPTHATNSMRRQFDG